MISQSVICPFIQIFYTVGIKREKLLRKIETKKERNGIKTSAPIEVRKCNLPFRGL